MRGPRLLGCAWYHGNPALITPVVRSRWEKCGHGSTEGQMRDTSAVHFSIAAVDAASGRQIIPQSAAGGLKLPAHLTVEMQTSSPASAHVFQCTMPCQSRSTRPPYAACMT